MRTLSVFAVAALMVAAPSVAFAQDTSASVPENTTETSLSEMSEKLADPEFQDHAAMMSSALVNVLLELPVGPMAEAMNDATGGRSPKVDPDARVRDLAPGADELPTQISENLPRAMNMMSGMAKGVDAMLPALLDMADQMRGAMEPYKTR